MERKQKKFMKKLKKIFNILIFFRQIFFHYIPNYIINKLPSYHLRLFYYKKIMGLKILKGSSIHMNTFVQGANPLKERFLLKENSSIGRNCYLDLRGELEIGKNVSISPDVKIITATHDLNSTDFKYLTRKVNIGNYVWIGTASIILPGVRIGEGAVVAAGSVVSRNVDDYSVVAGNPAKKIKSRNKQLEYTVRYFPLFD